MRFQTIVCGVSLLVAIAIFAQDNGLPVAKVYGVSIGGWLLSESWMFPNEWARMGGDKCANCSCVSTEFDLVKKLGQAKADKVFEKHWATWFTQKDVNAIADAGLNTVRIPVGYWIAEFTVDRRTEFFPQGGLKYLKNAVKMLKEKGIHVIIDLHALPGVSTPNQLFAGRCTGDVEFYTERNYNRALRFAAFMTLLIHVDPDFSTVFSIGPLNEPIMDASKTPGYGEYQKNFVKVVRLVELALGIICPKADYSKLFTHPGYNSSIDAGLLAVANFAEPALASILKTAAQSLTDVAPLLDLSHTHLRRAVGGGTGIDVSLREVTLQEISLGHGVGFSSFNDNGPPPASESIQRYPNLRSKDSSLDRRNIDYPRGVGVSASLAQGVCRQCLLPFFQNQDWQYGNHVSNPADAAIGPQAYDAHYYFAFGGVAQPNREDYMRVICTNDRTQSATKEKNRPLIYGEWSLATNFNASNDFYFDWADAQRINAMQAEGWIFWSWKIEPGSQFIPQWSYVDALKAGYFKKDPTILRNPNVCDQYRTQKQN